MKILRVTDLGYETGGVENGIVLMQSIFEQRGHEVRTLSSASRQDLPHFNQYSYRELPKNLLGKILYTFNPYAYSALKKALRDFEPDVVHVHTIGQASPLIFFPLKKYPTVLTVHGPEVYSKKLLLWSFPETDFKDGKREYASLTRGGKMRYWYHKLISDPLYALGFKNIDTVVTLSSYMHSLMEQEGLGNIYTPNGTLLLYEKSLQEDSITDTLVYVGRLEKYKGIEFAIRILPEIMKKHPRASLKIAGDGPDKQRLQKIASTLGVENNVFFLGHVSREELEKLYGEASIVIMPSVYPEAFGKVGIEAMSVGRPVVAFDVGGISDWLDDGKTGLLVPLENIQQLQKAVEKLLTDRHLLIMMGQNARRKSEEFDLLTHVIHMEKIYADSIASYKKK